MTPRVLLLDLFGTVVHFAPQVPTVEVAGTPWRTTMGWLQATAEDTARGRVLRPSWRADARDAGDHPHGRRVPDPVANASGRR
jgi:hypothetical protein